MSWVEAKCANCGGVLSVDCAKDAAICPYCGSAYVLGRVVQNYHITANTLNTYVVNVYGVNTARQTRQGTPFRLEEEGDDAFPAVMDDSLEEDLLEGEDSLEDENDRPPRPLHMTAYLECRELRQRLSAATGFDDLPAPEFAEKPELYRQRLRRAIQNLRTRAACLDLRRRLLERGLDHIPLPRDGETPEAYRRRIRKVRDILADRRK